MSNDELGMTWWNRLTATQRRYWLGQADSARPVDAWRTFQRGAPTAAQQRR